MYNREKISELNSSIPLNIEVLIKNFERIAQNLNVDKSRI